MLGEISLNVAMHYSGNTKIMIWFLKNAYFYLCFNYIRIFFTTPNGVETLINMFQYFDFDNMISRSKIKSALHFLSVVGSLRSLTFLRLYFALIDIHLLCKWDKVKLFNIVPFPLIKYLQGILRSDIFQMSENHQSRTYFIPYLCSNYYVVKSVSKVKCI